MEVVKLIDAVCKRNNTGEALPADVRERVDQILAPLIAEEEKAAAKAAAEKAAKEKAAKKAEEKAVAEATSSLPASMRSIAASSCSAAHASCSAVLPVSAELASASAPAPSKRRTHEAEPARAASISGVAFPSSPRHSMDARW